MMQCRICGYEFDETKRTETCKWCGGSDCSMVRCPNCGYEALPESKTDSKVVNFLKKKFRPESDKNLKGS